LANYDRHNLSLSTFYIFANTFSSATPVGKIEQQTYRLVTQRIDYTFPFSICQQITLERTNLDGFVLSPFGHPPADFTLNT
jgi:hypothetical protein